MAASMSSGIMLRVSQNIAILNRNTLYQTCNCFNHYVRQCSQFTAKAEQMDGNTYRLKNSKDSVFVREGNAPEKTTDTDSERVRHLPHYMEARARYYESREFMCKKYQWEGEASGIDPAIMWPTRKELDKIKEFEKEWCPPVQEMKAELEEERQIHRLRVLKREKLVAANMAKMPQMIAEWDGNIEKEKMQQEEQKKKRAKLLEDARIKMGYNVDHRSPHFKAMLEEMEKEEKQMKKDLKRKARMARLGMVKHEL